jgi:hypothetical protein
MQALHTTSDTMYAQRGARRLCLLLTSARALRNQRESPLLRLSAELRNRVYDYVLGNKTYSTVIILPTSRPNPNSLLLACRQVYHEASILPYTLNTFTFSSERYLRRAITLHKYARLNDIRTIELVTWCARRLLLDSSDWFHTMLDWILDSLRAFNGLQTVHIVVVWNLERSSTPAYRAEQIQQRSRFLADILKKMKPGLKITVRSSKDGVEKAVEY